MFFLFIGVIAKLYFPVTLTSLGFNEDYDTVFYNNSEYMLMIGVKGKWVFQKYGELCKLERKCGPFELRSAPLNRFKVIVSKIMFNQEKIATIIDNEIALPTTFLNQKEILDSKTKLVIKKKSTVQKTFIKIGEKMAFFSPKCVGIIVGRSRIQVEDGSISPTTRVLKHEKGAFMINDETWDIMSCDKETVIFE